MDNNNFINTYYISIITTYIHRFYVLNKIKNMKFEDKELSSFDLIENQIFRLQKSDIISCKYLGDNIYAPITDEKDIKNFHEDNPQNVFVNLPVSEYKDMKFNSYGELDTWLNKTASYIINLLDNGQDLQKIWVHESGEILNTDFQGSVWIGSFIFGIKDINEFDFLLLYNPRFDNNYREMRFQVDEIIKMKHEQVG